MSCPSELLCLLSFRLPSFFLLSFALCTTLDVYAFNTFLCQCQVPLQQLEGPIDRPQCGALVAGPEAGARAGAAEWEVPAGRAEVLVVFLQPVVLACVRVLLIRLDRSHPPKTRSTHTDVVTHSRKSVA